MHVSPCGPRRSEHALLQDRGPSEQRARSASHATPHNRGTPSPHLPPHPHRPRPSSRLRAPRPLSIRSQAPQLDAPRPRCQNRPRPQAPVAQLDRASVFGTEGWGFEPLRVRHLKWHGVKSYGGRGEVGLPRAGRSATLVPALVSGRRRAACPVKSAGVRSSPVKSTRVRPIGPRAYMTAALFGDPESQPCWIADAVA